MKNKANLNSLNLTANSCCIGGYNVIRTKTKNGTKPIKANLKPILKREARAFSGNTLPKNLFMRNEPNFKSPKFTANPCNRTAYNTFSQKTKNGTNPITNPIRTQYEPNTNPIKPNFTPPKNVPERIRTSNLWLRRPILYPVELRGLLERTSNNRKTAKSQSLKDAFSGYHREVFDNRRLRQ